MIQWVIDNRLAYADMDEGCGVRGSANVHACKAPCFIGIRPDAKGPPSPLAPTTIERGNDLYLNMIDPDRPLFRLAMFQHYMDFVDRHFGRRPVIVHCKQGRSRSPSLVLLWLAKRTDVLPSHTYAAALAVFASRWPCSPRAGIVSWLHHNWDSIPKTPL